METILFMGLGFGLLFSSVLVLGSLWSESEMKQRKVEKEIRKVLRDSKHREVHALLAVETARIQKSRRFGGVRRI